MFALGLLLLAKLANVGVPLALKQAVDALDPQQQDIICLPVMMLVAYGVLRLANSLFSDLRDALFAEVIFRSIRRIAYLDFQPSSPPLAAISLTEANRGNFPGH